jgi:hypothetical protein
MRVITAATLDDAQLERIIKAADPKAVVFCEETRVIDGEAIKEKRLCEKWIELRNQLFYFEYLYQEDVRQRAAPSEAPKKRARIAKKAKELASLVADDPGLAHHCDALSRLITDAIAELRENPELEKRDKRAAIDVMIRDRLMPLVHEYFGQQATRVTVDPIIGAYGPFIDIVGAVLKELKITKADGSPYSPGTIAAARAKFNLEKEAPPNNSPNLKR